MTSQLAYKGYTGSIEVSLDDLCLRGQLQGITDVITYEGETVSELIKDFKIAVRFKIALNWCIEMRS